VTEQQIEQEPMDLEAKLIEKAMADEAFKRELMSNPKAAIAKEVGQELPAELEFEVLEQTPTKLYLVLPMSESAEDSPSEELAEEQLEAVAGGILPGGCWPQKTIWGCPIRTKLICLKF
jgi:hypothetical protein